jgi:hypothetical protein
VAEAADGDAASVEVGAGLEAQRCRDLEREARRYGSDERNLGPEGKGARSTQEKKRAEELPCHKIAAIWLSA